MTLLFGGTNFEVCKVFLPGFLQVFCCFEMFCLVAIVDLVSFRAKAYQEICLSMFTTQINARTYHAYHDEDAMGSVKAICRKTHRALMEVRVMGRILLGLKVAGHSGGV